MVSEPWIHKMRNQVSTYLKHTLSFNDHSTTAITTTRKKEHRSPEPEPNSKNTTIGILSFEVANAMSKAVHLHKSLSDSEVSRLRHEVLKSHAIKTLVSPNESYLLELALAEKLDDLNRIAAVVSRLGKRCTERELVGFEHVYKDILNGRVEVSKLGFFVKDMERTIKKMEQYVCSTASLYGELEVLNELEQGVKKFQLCPQYEETRRAFEQKIQWQRHDLRHLRDVSLWNQTYDKIVRLMAKALCTIYARIRVVFGEYVLASECLPNESRQFSEQIVPCRHYQVGSGQLQSYVNRSKSGPIPQRRQVNMYRESLGFHCGSSPSRLFMECLSLGGSASWKNDAEQFDGESCYSQVGMSLPFSGDQKQYKCAPGRSGSLLKSKLTMQATSSTVGGAGLALHYANIIIIIEKLLHYPHLVGEEARDDLYQMLPSSLKMSLRRSLKSYVKNLAIYDAPLAHDWKEKLDKILMWLTPMAHNMMRWQTEHNFEQQQIVSRANVLLLQTLYFADREKTETAVCELLTGLNYICRYQQQQNALLDCTSSADFGDYVEWQLQY